MLSELRFVHFHSCNPNGVPIEFCSRRVINWYICQQNQYMFIMDSKGINWVGNVYQKFEAMCLELEEAVCQVNLWSFPITSDNLALTFTIWLGSIQAPFSCNETPEHSIFLDSQNAYSAAKDHKLLQRRRVMLDMPELIKHTSRLGVCPTRFNVS